MATFHCIDCDKDKPIQTNGGTGYATTDKGLVCYECCAKRDRDEMVATGRATLYLTIAKDGKNCTVSNWPGSLKFTGGWQKGRHNIARVRYDVWFVGPDGANWHGVQYGDNTQICHCRRTKVR